MLTMPQQLPVKRMALYGSAAMLVGFVSTLGVLQQFTSKDSPSGLAVVETINKKPMKTTANGIETKQADNQAVSTPALPDQADVVISNGRSSAQQYPWSPSASSIVSPSTPTHLETAPVVPSSTTTQPSTVNDLPASTPMESSNTLPNLQNTIMDINVVDAPSVQLP